MKTLDDESNENYLLSKINFDSINILKNDFISLELIILERESNTENK